MYSFTFLVKVKIYDTYVLIFNFTFIINVIVIF